MCQASLRWAVESKAASWFRVCVGGGTPKLGLRGGGQGGLAVVPSLPASVFGGRVLVLTP